jgi:hypothetical protein
MAAKRLRRDLVGGSPTLVRPFRTFPLPVAREAPCAPHDEGPLLRMTRVPVGESVAQPIKASVICRVVCAATRGSTAAYEV